MITSAGRGRYVACEIKVTGKGTVVLERVLIVDPNPANTRLLADLLRNVSLCQVHWAQNEKRGLAMARDLDPQIIFAELKAPELDGLEFTRKLRRSDLTCRDAPVVVVTTEATAQSIMASRDAGVHEFLRRPFNMGDLQKRIDAVALKKRDWVEAVAYIGPDRRRFNSADYSGPRKRRSDEGTPEMQRIGQALKIVKSAIGAIERDPKQVWRALKAQADALRAIAHANPAHGSMGLAADGLHAYLDEALKAGRLSRESIEKHGAALLAAAPAEARPEDGPRQSNAA
jgi:two-component system, response regulator PdtaR